MTNEIYTGPVRMPEDAKQQSTDSPLFRNSAGATFSMAANPSSADANDDPWIELVKEIAPGADPRALRMAHLIHLAIKPAATILFGSRARGDYNERSDVDISIITPEPVPSGAAERAAAALYENAPEIEIINYTLDDYHNLERYRNTAVTEGLTQGVVIAPSPDQWASRYAGTDPIPTRYEWSQYRHLSQASKMGLDAALVGIDQKLPNDEFRASIYKRVMEDMDGEELERWRASMATTNLRSAMKYALMATIASVGRLPKKNAPVTELLPAAREAINETELDNLKVAPEEYDRSDELDLDASKSFNERALADVKTTRKVATRHHRRTKRQYG